MYSIVLPTITIKESGHQRIQFISNWALSTHKKRVVSITKSRKKPTKVEVKPSRLGFEPKTHKVQSPISYFHIVEPEGRVQLVFHYFHTIILFTLPRAQPKTHGFVFTRKIPRPSKTRLEYPSLITGFILLFNVLYIIKIRNVRISLNK